jgi:hypothetical protein
MHEQKAFLVKVVRLGTTTLQYKLVLSISAQGFTSEEAQTGILNLRVGKIQRFQVDKRCKYQVTVQTHLL